MGKFNAQDAGLFLLALAEVPQVMSAFLPSPFTAATFGGTEKARWLRRGEVIGSVVALSIAAAVSLVARRREPFIGAILVLGVFLWEYEKAMRYGREHGQDMSDGPAG